MLTAEFPLSTGLRLNVINRQPEKAMSLEVVKPDIYLCRFPEAAYACDALQIESPHFVLAFSFVGVAQARQADAEIPQGLMRLLPPGSNILPAPEQAGSLICISDQRMKCILGQAYEQFFERISSLLAGQSGKDKQIRLPLLPDQLLAGISILNSDFSGATRQIYLKGKIFELLALFIHQLENLDGDRLSALSPADRATLINARDYYLQRLSEPPTLSQVARQAGTNETKLKRLFKEVYGISPYAFVLGERLSLARQILASRQANVSEAASQVGYSNVSHFIEAFYRVYGIRPGELLRKLD